MSHQNTSHPGQFPKYLPPAVFAFRTNNGTMTSRATRHRERTAGDIFCLLKGVCDPLQLHSTWNQGDTVRMNSALQELARHNTWANNVLIDFCADLDPEALSWTAPGTYGTILTTLQHLVDAEAGYIHRLMGKERPTDWLEEANAGSPKSGTARTSSVSNWWRILANDWDTEALGLGRGDDGVVFEIRVDIFLIQLIHHGNEHRAHVCTVLGAHGIEPPEVSAWGYAEPAAGMGQGIAALS